MGKVENAAMKLELATRFAKRERCTQTQQKKSRSRRCRRGRVSLAAIRQKGRRKVNLQNRSRLIQLDCASFEPHLATR